MSDSAVTIEREVPGVATVVLDRPDVLNVFSGGMGAQLSAAYAECDADPEIRVIVLTGRGRAFCAGADMTPQSATFGTPGAGFSSQPLENPAWPARLRGLARVENLPAQRQAPESGMQSTVFVSFSISFPIQVTNGILSLKLKPRRR